MMDKTGIPSAAPGRTAPPRGSPPRRPRSRRPSARVIARRRAVALGVIALAIASMVVLIDSSGGSAAKRPTADNTVRRRRAGPPSDRRRLSLLETITGHISPKSVAASDTGLVVAQNMMYTHTVTVYDGHGRLVKTIPDTVDMSQFGIPGHPGISHGAPVEAAFTPDARYVYVSNYSITAAGSGPRAQTTAPRRAPGPRGTSTATCTASAPRRWPSMR